MSYIKLTEGRRFKVNESYEVIMKELEANISFIELRRHDTALMSSGREEILIQVSHIISIEP